MVSITGLYEEEGNIMGKKKSARRPTWNQVKLYRLRWSAQLNKGFVELQLANNKLASIQVDSPQELSALGDMLRNERPIFYNPKFQELYTGGEPTGELEPIR